MPHSKHRKHVIVFIDIVISVIGISVVIVIIIINCAADVHQRAELCERNRIDLQTPIGDDCIIMKVIVIIINVIIINIITDDDDDLLRFSKILI